MTEFAFWDIKYSSFNLEDRNVLGRETCSHMFKDEIRLHLIATREYVKSTVLEFGPRMDGDMGFCDHDDTTDAVRGKLVEEGLDDCRAGLAYGFYENMLKSDGIVQNGLVASVQLYN